MKSIKMNLTGWQRYLKYMVLMMLLQSTNLQSAQQFQGLCSFVKIEILQELALERIGFLATLEITNNEGDASITDFSAGLTFQIYDADGNIVDVSDKFFVQPPTVTGISDVDGTGIIAPAQTATISWFIIPKITAGGESAAGLQYQVGAQLAGSLYGEQLAPEILSVIPDTITVKPEPQLDITYFQPRDVDGDDPFTTEIVETPVPFTLGVLVNNVGFGRANNIRIKSEQPRIVENLQGLLVVPQLIGARVDDNPTDHASLTVELGDIEPGKCRKGAWDMITSLSGEFTEFKASYTHASELGGRDTSVIKDINAYFIMHEVQNDQPGRDNLLDFLADTETTKAGGEELIPDTLYETDCNTLPVNHLLNTEVTAYSGFNATVHASADFENWVYIRVDDPAQAKYKIEQVLRSDGKVLNPNNYWTNIRYHPDTNEKLTYLNVFDFVALGEYDYSVTYLPPEAEVFPPVTTLLFSGQSEFKEGKYYVSEDTQMLFIAEDDSPVSTVYRLNGTGDFLPAYPFTLFASGEHLLEFYSEDSNGNVEETKTAILVLSDIYPEIIAINSDTDELFITGESVSVRPNTVKLEISGSTTAGSLEAKAEVYQGVYAFPVLSGVPSTPTAQTTASITVSGINVDFYKYQINSGGWSAEQPVSSTIELAALMGPVQLEVLGRSQHNNYPQDESEAVSRLWIVGTDEVLGITGVPESPTWSTDALLTVTGSDSYCFRVDNTYFRPENGVGIPIELSRLGEGEHLVEVLPRINNDVCPADGSGVEARWTVDQQYGVSLPETAKKREDLLGVLGPAALQYSWDGRDNNGVVVSPDWYSIKVTVEDGLGRMRSGISLVQIGDMLSGGGLLSDVGAASQKEAHAYKDWVVWQDQRLGNWDVYAQNLRAEGAVPVAISSNIQHQEKPRTDGRYVVWEDRQDDGTWDIWIKDLETADVALPVTATADVDEKKPVVYWPWVVYQTKAVANPEAPWQLKATNLLSAETQIVDTTTQDQLDPSIYKQRIVWQDFRDVGPGEIYSKDLRTGVVTRITDNPAGQYYPVIHKQWIVWADNRNLQLDLYAHNLNRHTEIQLTDTPEDETRPYLNGPWVVYQEDSAGEQRINLRTLHLNNLASVQLTNMETEKEKPSLASEQLIWVDSRNGHQQVMMGKIPDLQPVFNNQNAIAVSSGMVASSVDAFALLERWQQEAGVTAVSRYTALIPTPIIETVEWAGGQATGNNFNLEEGSFLWVKFGSTRILDLGVSQCNNLDLSLGVNVFSYTCFPDHYSSYQLLRSIGLANVNAIRILNAENGHWQVANVDNGNIVGSDFPIANVAVIMLDMKQAVSAWIPGE